MNRLNLLRNKLHIGGLCALVYFNDKYLWKGQRFCVLAEAIETDQVSSLRNSKIHGDKMEGDSSFYIASNDDEMIKTEFASNFLRTKDDTIRKLTGNQSNYYKDLQNYIKVIKLQDQLPAFTISTVPTMLKIKQNIAFAQYNQGKYNEAMLTLLEGISVAEDALIVSENQSKHELIVDEVEKPLQTVGAPALKTIQEIPIQGALPSGTLTHDEEFQHQQQLDSLILKALESRKELKEKNKHEISDHLGKEKQKLKDKSKNGQKLQEKPKRKIEEKNKTAKAAKKKKNEKRQHTQEDRNRNNEKSTDEYDRHEVKRGEIDNQNLGIAKDKREKKKDKQKKSAKKLKMNEGQMTASVMKETEKAISEDVPYEKPKKKHNKQISKYQNNLVDDKNRKIDKTVKDKNDGKKTKGKLSKKKNKHEKIKKSSNKKKKPTKEKPKKVKSKLKSNLTDDTNVEKLETDNYSKKKKNKTSKNKIEKKNYIHLLHDKDEPGGESAKIYKEKSKKKKESPKKEKSKDKKDKLKKEKDKSNGKKEKLKGKKDKSKDKKEKLKGKKDKSKDKKEKLKGKKDQSKDKKEKLNGKKDKSKDEKKKLKERKDKLKEKNEKSKKGKSKNKKKKLKKEMKASKKKNKESKKKEDAPKKKNKKSDREREKPKNKND